MRSDVLNRPTPSPIPTRPVFERPFFSQCWEDPRMDETALPVGPGRTALVVTSGGCTALTLVLRGPDRLLAVDRSHAQSHLLRLKIAGAKSLEHREYLELLGVRRSARRRDLYGRARRHLPASSRDFWDARGNWLEQGVHRAGRYERYLDLYRRLLLLVQGRDRIEGLFRARSLEEQRAFYQRRWDTRAWRGGFRAFCSRAILGFAGLDQSFLTSVEGHPDLGREFLLRARHALTELPVRDNYFLAQICLGRYLDEQAMPPYLLAENFEALRGAVDRIEVHTEEPGTLLQRLPGNSVDAFALSNVLERIPADAFLNLHREIHRAARPGARLCYRTLVVRRQTPDGLACFFRREPDLAARLLWNDRSFVYSHFEVATVCKPPRWDASTKE